MTSRDGAGGPRDHGQHGQMIVLFALSLVAIIAVAGLLIDGGRAWSNRRQAQAAADTAALAAAKDIVVTGDDPFNDALAVAQVNRFGTDTTDCSGTTLTGNAGPGVQVNNPPLSGPHTVANDPLHASEYVEVITTRKMTTTFSAVVGMSCWMVSARAVSSIGVSSVAQCSFCSLNTSDDNHTLVLKNGATLRVDGDIYVNSTNGGTTPAHCDDAKEVDQWDVCGDAFDVFGDGGQISARTISVVGGWETHDDNPTKADRLATVMTGTPPAPVPCPLHPDPPLQVTLYPLLVPSNVCIHMPQIPDPLNDPTKPGNVIPPPSVLEQTTPVAGVNGCPSGATVPNAVTGVLPDIGAGTHTICPGKYVQGITIKNAASVTMRPGVYYMLGGGFQVANAASVDGSSGVMIYNTSGAAAGSSTTEGTSLVPACTSGLCVAPDHVELKASEDHPLASEVVTLTMIVDKRDAHPSPTGTVTFYDGDLPIPGCSDITLAPRVPPDGMKVQAQCMTSWPIWGTHHIRSTYFGDSIYKAVGKTKTITINAPGGTGAGAVTLATTGNVKLSGMSAGPYAGLTIFQERGQENVITIAPGSGSPTACTGTWLTADVPHVSGGSPPPPCGPLGGIRGTIYAPASHSLGTDRVAWPCEPADHLGNDPDHE